MDRRPSGLPDHKVMPTIRQSEVDYDAEMHAHHGMTDDVRRTMLVALGTLAVLGIVFAVTERTGSAAIMVFLGTPLLLVLLGNELLARWIRRRLVGRSR